MFALILTGLNKDHNTGYSTLGIGLLVEGGTPQIKHFKPTRALCFIPGLLLGLQLSQEVQGFSGPWGGGLKFRVRSK